MATKIYKNKIKISMKKKTIAFIAFIVTVITFWDVREMKLRFS